MLRHFTVLNQNSGSFSEKTAERIEHFLKPGKNIRGIIYETYSLSSLEEILREHKDDPRLFGNNGALPLILGIGGGDGTIAETITSMRRVWEEIPKDAVFAIFKLGSRNALARLCESDNYFCRAKRTLKIGELQSVEMARYLRNVADGKKELHTIPVELIQTNDFYGFNFGLGIVPKLIWRYYGKSVSQYNRLMGEMEGRDGDSTRPLIRKYLREKSVLEGLVKMMPLRKAVAEPKSFDVAKIVLQSIAGAIGLLPEERQFYSQPLEVDVYIDGKKIDLRGKPTAIYTASYPHVNTGIPFLNPIPLPEARAINGMIQVGITYGSPVEIVASIPTILSGKHMANADYFHARELRIVSKRPLLAQVDAEFLGNQEYVVKPVGYLKLVAPNGK